MTPELANRLIDFFKTPGPYAAYLVGGGLELREVPIPAGRGLFIASTVMRPGT